MFNVGIVASGRAGPLVKLTSRIMGPVQYPQAYFYGDGRLDVAGVGFITGEWFTQAPQVNVGSQYQIRYTLYAGSGPLDYLSNSVAKLWNDIHVHGYNGRLLVWDDGIGGRVLIEIRNKATQQVLASAQMWTPGFAP